MVVTVTTGLPLKCSHSGCSSFSFGFWGFGAFWSFSFWSLKNQNFVIKIKFWKQGFAWLAFVYWFQSFILGGWLMGSSDLWVFFFFSRERELKQWERREGEIEKEREMAEKPEALDAVLKETVDLVNRSEEKFDLFFILHGFALSVLLIFF